MSLWDTAIGTGLGFVPVVGPELSGAYGGWQGGIGKQGNPNPYIDQALQDTEVPRELSKGFGALSGAAIGASATIPVAGPFIAAGLSIASMFRKKHLGKGYSKDVKEKAMQLANQQSQNAMSAQGFQQQQARTLQQNQQLPGQYRPMPMPGLGDVRGVPMQQSQQAASNYHMGPAGYPVANQPRPRPRPQNGMPGTYGSTPYGPQGGLSRGTGQNNNGYEHKPVSPKERLMNQLIKQHLMYGLDPRILQGQNMAAINAGMDARQQMANSLGRSGDTSGYNYGVGAGIDMGVANQLASIYPQWLQQNQDYIDQLVGMLRGTRKGSVPPNPAPSGGRDTAGIIAGLGGLANGIGNAYGSFQGQQAAAPDYGSWWGSGNQGPLPG